MIESVHKEFLHWAWWVKSPRGGINLGYGKNVLQRIREGRGQVLPGSTVAVTSKDAQMASKVDLFVRGLPRDDRFLVRSYYLSGQTASDVAKWVGLPRRTMYGQLDRIHREYLEAGRK